MTGITERFNTKFGKHHCSGKNCGHNHSHAGLHDALLLNAPLTDTPLPRVVNSFSQAPKQPVYISAYYPAQTIAINQHHHHHDGDCCHRHHHESATEKRNKAIKKTGRMALLLTGLSPLVTPILNKIGFKFDLHDHNHDGIFVDLDEAAHGLYAGFKNISDPEKMLSEASSEMREIQTQTTQYLTKEANDVNAIDLSILGGISALMLPFAYLAAKAGQEEAQEAKEGLKHFKQLISKAKNSQADHKALCKFAENIFNQMSLTERSDYQTQTVNRLQYLIKLKKLDLSFGRASYYSGSAILAKINLEIGSKISALAGASIASTAAVGIGLAGSGFGVLTGCFAYWLGNRASKKSSMQLRLLKQNRENVSKYLGSFKAILDTNEEDKTAFTNFIETKQQTRTQFFSKYKRFAKIFKWGAVAYTAIGATKASILIAGLVGGSMLSLSHPAISVPLGFGLGIAGLTMAIGSSTFIFGHPTQSRYTQEQEQLLTQTQLQRKTRIANLIDVLKKQKNQIEQTLNHSPNQNTQAQKQKLADITSFVKALEKNLAQDMHLQYQSTHHEVNFIEALRKQTYQNNQKNAYYFAQGLSENKQNKTKEQQKQAFKQSKQKLGFILKRNLHCLYSFSKAFGKAFIQNKGWTLAKQNAQQQASLCKQSYGITEQAFIEQIENDLKQVSTHSATSTTLKHMQSTHQSQVNYLNLQAQQLMATFVSHVKNAENTINATLNTYMQAFNQHVQQAKQATPLQRVAQHHTFNAWLKNLQTVLNAQTVELKRLIQEAKPNNTNLLEKVGLLDAQAQQIQHLETIYSQLIGQHDLNEQFNLLNQHLAQKTNLQLNPPETTDSIAEDDSQASTPLANEIQPQIDALVQIDTEITETVEQITAQYAKLQAQKDAQTVYKTWFMDGETNYKAHRARRNQLYTWVNELAQLHA